jgi:membrane protein DedA with SNARE-associated domain
MDFYLGSLLSYVLLYKYVALFVIVYLGAVIVPWPVNAMLTAVGAFSSQGYFNFWIALAVAVIANTLGDCTDYGITRIWGDWVIKKLRIDRVRFFVRLREELRTDAAITVFTTRFAGSLSSITNFLAGWADVPFGLFLFYDFLGNFIEPGAALLIGYAVGNYWSDFSGFFGTVTAIVAVSVVIFVLVRMQRRMLKKYGA